MKNLPKNYYAHGMLITIITITLVELLTRIGIRVPNPAVIYLTAVVYVTFTGGMVPGIICGTITLLYGAYFFSIPGNLFHYSDDNFARVIVLCFATPAMIIMVGILKQRNDSLLSKKEQLISELKSALAKIDVLEGILPICASCKKIRDDKGSWNQMESYISEHSQAQFSHGLCPDCAAKALEEIRRYK
jgi:K+-sensing histidine kinase KdpD